MTTPTDNDLKWLLSLVRQLSDTDVEQCETAEEVAANVADLLRAERLINSLIGAPSGFRS